MKLAILSERRRILELLIALGIIVEITFLLSFVFWQRAEQISYQTKVDQRTNLLGQLKVQTSLEIARLNSTYNFDLNRSLTPSVSKGLLGFTVVPRGGGVGDKLSEEPVIPPTNFTRVGGTNFHYGPVQKTTKVEIINATLIMGAFENSNVTITLTWGSNDPLKILDFQIGGSQYGIVRASLDATNMSIIIAPGQMASLDVVSTNKALLFNSDSFVWISLKEAPIPPPSPPSFPPETTEVDASKILGPLQEAPPLGALDFISSQWSIAIPLIFAGPITVVSGLLIEDAKQKSKSAS